MIPERSKRLTRTAPPGAPPWILAIFVVESLVSVGVHWRGNEPGVVSAYIDPGSGALFVQIVLSVAFGFLLYLRRVRRFLGRLLPWPRRQDDGASNKTE